MHAIFSSIQITMPGPRQRSTSLFFLLAATVAVFAASADSASLPATITTAPLSVDQVVNNLVRKDKERAQALRHYESTRVYRLSYRGFPGDREAEMTVAATYHSHSTKNFKVISQTGSKLILDHVFKRLLHNENEPPE